MLDLIVLLLLLFINLKEIEESIWMLNGQRNDCVTYFFLLAASIDLYCCWFFLAVLISQWQESRKYIFQNPLKQVSGLNSTKQRPQSLKEAETIILHPARSPHRLQQRGCFVAPSAPLKIVQPWWAEIISGGLLWF